MANNEIEFLECLDKAVEWEKEKQIRLRKARKPFKKDEILKLIEGFEFKKLKSTKDCVERMKMLKVINNAFTRRMFLSLIRENFENINYANLTSNPIYNSIKSEILQANPNLTFVEDKWFLRQIGNAFAHGNYDSLLNMKKLNNIWTGATDEKVDFTSREKSNIYSIYSDKDFEEDANYNTKVNEIKRNVHNALQNPQKITNLSLFVNFLNNTTNSNTLVETLDFRYESNRMLDVNGNVVDRPAPVNFNLTINRSQLDSLILVLLAEREIPGYIVQEKHGQNTLVEIPANAKDEDVAKYLLSSNKFYALDVKTNTQTEVQFDDKQKEIFINEYVSSREWFNKDFFNVKNPFIKDVLSTNQNSHVITLNNFFFPTITNQAAANISIENIQSLYDLAKHKLKSANDKNIPELVASVGEYTYNLKQVFNSYSEALTTEMLLILQLIEDNQLFATCEGNSAIANIVNGLNQTEILKLRTSPKYKNDVHSILYHLRDSFTHLMYLNNLNKELFIYDYTSKKNKTPDFKFTISLVNLEKLKNELLSVVKTHYSTKIHNTTANAETSEDLTV